MTDLLKRLCEVDPTHFARAPFGEVAFREEPTLPTDQEAFYTNVDWRIAGWMLEQMNERLNASDALNPGEVSTLLTSLANMLLHLTPEKVAELYIGWKEIK